MSRSTFFTLFAFVLSATLQAAAQTNGVGEIQSFNPSFGNAGIQGCVSAQSNEDGAPVVIHNCNTEDTANQNWALSFFDRENAGPEPITIFGDKCIDVTGGVNADGTKVQIWTCVPGSTNQQWISVTDQTLQWAGTNKCLDLTGGSITDGTQLQIWTCATGNDNQRWGGANNPDAVITAQISLTVSRPAACISASADEDGASVVIVPCLNSTAGSAFPNNITFTVPVSPLSGPITTFNNKCIDVPNGSTTNGVKLQIWTCFEGNTNQMFRVNSTQIEWAGTGKCLDLTGGNTTTGTPLQLWDCANQHDDFNPNQDWEVNNLNAPS
ncbi:ricin B lectin domain-containing protein [Mycena epipterygia]|nr:ricin B lectin domain-containing protein [Mycena epipterygia]